MLAWWKVFLALRYFLYVVPLRILGGGPRILRRWPYHSFFWHLQLDLDFAYWMIGQRAPIAGDPSMHFRRPRLRWFFGGDRISK